jgi:hypothetical protein
MGPSVESIRVLSVIPGRMRLHMPGWADGDRDELEARLRQAPGVEAVEANPLTGNVLIRFDPRTVGPKRLLAALQPPGPGPQAILARAALNDVMTSPGRTSSASPLLQVAVRGVLGHAAMDALWFGAGFLGQSVGLPLAGLGPLHFLLDVLVWGAALTSATGVKTAPGCP